MQAGKDYPLEIADLLKIKSPKAHLTGPFVVVHLDTKDRWAIVAADWNKEPRLAIRWFYGKSGQPFSRQSTWLVIPPQLNTAILNTLTIPSNNRKLLDDYLVNQITGEELKTQYQY